MKKNKCILKLPASSVAARHTAFAPFRRVLREFLLHTYAIYAACLRNLRCVLTQFPLRAYAAASRVSTLQKRPYKAVFLKIMVVFLPCFFSAECAFALSVDASKKRAGRWQKVDTQKEEPLASLPDSLPGDTIVLHGKVYCLVKSETLPRLDAATHHESVYFDTVGMQHDDFSHLFDQMVNVWFAARMEQPDCQADSLITPPTDSLYRERLSRLPHLIAMPYNSRVRSMIEMYMGKNRELLSRMLSLSEHYFPLFEQALDARGMPLELKYLPVIESALNATAVSRMGAAGLWQFMVATGRLYGLEINSLVDERMDPAKSTEAAVRFLADLYKMYGDWHLAIAAYNCGSGNVNKAIRRSGGKRDFWAIYHHLPRETRGYVPIFIAANYAMNYAEAHGICPAVGDSPEWIDTVMVTDRIHFEQLSAVLGIPKEKIQMLNPQYRREIIPGDIRPYALRLPLQYATAYVEKSDLVCSYKADELINNRQKEIEIYRSAPPGASGNLVYHRVKSGETLGHIALRYGTSTAKLRQWNNISGSRIYAGQNLKIYL